MLLDSRERSGGDDLDPMTPLDQATGEVINVTFQATDFRREVDAMEQDVHAPAQSLVSLRRPVRFDTSTSAILSPAAPSP